MKITNFTIVFLSIITIAFQRTVPVHYTRKS